MKLAIAAFTDRGEALSKRIGKNVTRIGGNVTLADWTAARFADADALLFVGATGIAVRAIAPHLKSKISDPAVLVADEAGRFVIPILSGHLGGANALAEEIAATLQATVVITTATDLRGVFAVDLWAKAQAMTVLQPERIKRVSAKLLAGETIAVDCPWPIKGVPPEGVRLDSDADVTVSVRPEETDALQLVPRCLTLGVGCRRGASEAQIEAVFRRFCAEHSVLPEAVSAAASIDRKSDEAGLLAFCASHGWPVRFFTADALNAAEGSFSHSDFVLEAVGVDNVCERSAVCASGGALLEKKYASDGVTFAIAVTQPELDWSW